MSIGTQVFVSSLDDKFSPDKIVPAIPNDGNFRNKPDYGIWTSTLIGEDSSDWIEWARGEDFYSCDEFEAAIIIPKETVKVFHIAGMIDLIKISTANMQKPFLGKYPKAINFTNLMEEGYDGLHLTKEGSRNLRDLWFPDEICGVNTWDCESTVWFNNSWFDEYIHIKMVNYKLQRMKD